MADGLGCKLNLDREIAADALSKGDWDRAWSHMPGKDTYPKRIPRVLLQWITNPLPDLSLREMILREMSETTQVLYEELNTYETPNRDYWELNPNFGRGFLESSVVKWCCKI